MISVIVNDASCLIDLKKGRLLRFLLRLPYGFIVPWPIREWELLNFRSQEWQDLDDAGLVTYDLSGEEMAEVAMLNRKHGRLSPRDCSALITATRQENAILLTGDNHLRKVAKVHGVRVHGALWIIDELHAAKICEVALLISALCNWQADQAVFLPEDEIRKRLCRLQGA